jgi:hypothetical protein
MTSGYDGQEIQRYTGTWRRVIRMMILVQAALESLAMWKVWPLMSVSSRPRVPNYTIGRDRGEE